MNFLQDIRIAARLLRRSPGTTAVALLSIALSIGATSVVFAAIKSVLMDPLPYARPEELVLLRSEFPKLQQQSTGNWIVYNDWRELPRRTRTLQTIGIYGNAILDLTGDPNTTPESLYGLQMSADLFPVLGVKPMLGRNVLPEEDQPGHSDVLILSYGLWVRRFHSDPSIVGRTVMGNGHACLVIGVMPPGFNYPLRREAQHTPSPYVEFWMSPFHQGGNPNSARGAVARLRPGISIDDARREMASISRDLEREFPATNRDRLIQVNFLRDRMVGQASRGLALLMSAALLFMLIGCANVANLLLARGLGRQREVAVRMALGAGRARIVRQLLTESCVLAALGGLCGYLLTALAWRVLPAIAPVSIPRLAAARADTGVFGFALVMAVVNGALFGLAPAVRMAMAGSLTVRSAVGTRRDRMRSVLVAAEIAVSVLLVVSGGEVLAAFLRLVAVDPGFEADRVLASVVLPNPSRYKEPEKRGLLYRRILDSVRAIPGVESAGTVDALPFSGENFGGSVSAIGGSDERPLTSEIDTVGGEYLQSLGIRLQEGRWFREEDTASSGDGALISPYVAQRLWPGESAIGKRICVYCTPENPSGWKQVVGVVSPANHVALDESEKGNVYLASDAMRKAQFLVVRTRRPEGEMSVAIRRAIAALDPNQPVFLSVTMSALIADSIADRRFIALLLAITGCLALAMSAAGVYGVMAYTTSRRTAELGIRMAVGAAPRNIFGLIFRDGFRTVAVGVLAGIGASVVCVRYLREVVAGADGGAGYVGMAVALVVATAALACWIPARRATRTDPLAALREE
jgi:putative ABC transport system permease protein